MGARGTRRIAGVLTVVGALAFAGSASGANSVAYQIDPQHDGHVEGANLDPPYHRIWQRQFQTSVSYPLIVGSRVFVAVAKPSADGTILYALSRKTGRTLWSYPLGGQYPWSGIAYGGGQLYAVTALGFLRALDPATGDQIWLRHLPGQSSFSSTPTYDDGLLYVVGGGAGGTLYAVTPDGNVAWSQPTLLGSDESSPAVGRDRVFVSYTGPQVYAFDKTTGAPSWHYDSGVHGGGGSTPVLHDGRLYVRDRGVAYVLDVTTGNLIDTFDVGPAPALAGDRGYRVPVDGRRVESWDLTTGYTRWFVGDPYRGVGGAFTSAPLILNDEVIEGSVEGNVYGIKGKVNWQDAVGQPIYGPNEQVTQRQLLTGLAAGQGTLVVPANTKLVAYTGS